MLDRLTNKEGLVGSVELKGSLGCSEREMVELEIHRAVSHPNGGIWDPQRCVNIAKPNC